LVIGIVITGTTVASTPTQINNSNGGTITVPNVPEKIGNKILSPAIVYSSITQGGTNWHSKNLNSYCNYLNVDLNWGNQANSLELTIYGPDGSTYGPFYDNADGYIDGRINIYLYNPDGVPQGTWWYEVYGYSVIGTQSYSI
jgi:hypothetical protein